MKTKEEPKLKLPRRGAWGGYEVCRVGGGRPYFWIGQDDKYLLALTVREAKKLAAFLKK
jgi:hypothetical protein